MEELWNALTQWLQAQNAHDKALEQYDGYSWDYAGYNYIKAAEEARDKATNTLDKLIDARIEKAFKERDNSGLHTI